MIAKVKNITTKHAIIVGTILLTAWLLWTGLMQPNGFVMSFANNGIEHSLLRLVILGSLVAILVSRPPRTLPLRFLLGAVSSLTLIVACASMVDYQIGILDAILYLEVSIILAIEAIENQPATVKFARTSMTSHQS